MTAYKETYLEYVQRDEQEIPEVFEILYQDPVTREIWREEFSSVEEYHENLLEVQRSGYVLVYP